MAADGRGHGGSRLVTRRRVLIAAGGVTAAAGLGVGAFVVEDRLSRFGRAGARLVPDHRVAPPVGAPPLVVARGGDPAANVRAALAALGGIAHYVTAQDHVLIKPNIGWLRTPEQAANTHPEVVAELVRLCREVGPARLVVSDCPVRRSRGAFERSGILAAASAAGAEVIIPEESRHVAVEISPRLGTWDILEPFASATKVINVPVAKHHSLTGVAAGMKNWIGITNKLRLTFHEDLDRSLAELAALMRPTLTVVDATRVLMQDGPEGGSLDHVQPMGMVAAGVDPVALDAWAFSLFGAGATPRFLEHAVALGLGELAFAGRLREVSAG